MRRFSMRVETAIASEAKCIARWTDHIDFDALMDDPRQTDPMLAVNNNLQAIESPQGHGDSFWSGAMTLPEREEQQEAFVVVG